MWHDIGEFFYFWGRCFKEGFHFTWDTFGVFDLACAAIATVLFLFGKPLREQWEQTWVPIVRTIICVIIAATFLFSVLGIAPYLQYAEKKSPDETNHYIPYEMLTNQLGEAKADAEKQRQRADSENNRAEAERQRAELKENLLVKAYSSTNAVPNDLAPFQSLIQEKEREIDNLNPTNDEDSDLRFQSQIELGKERNLETQLEELQIKKMVITPIYAIWVYIISTFQARLAPYAEQCGGNAINITLPTIDDICSGKRLHEDVTLGTNCFWKCYCALEGGFPPYLILVSNGQVVHDANIGVGYVDTSYREIWVKLKIADVEILSTNCSISSISTCVGSVDKFMKTLMNYQKKEFVKH